MKKIWVNLCDLDTKKKELLFSILDTMERKYTIVGHGIKRRVEFKMAAHERWNILDKEGYTWWQNK